MQNEQKEILKNINNIDELMFSNVTSHLVYQVLNAPIREYPFPHFFNTNMFPEAFYAEILKHMPDKNAYQTLIEQGQVTVQPDSVEVYEQRTVITLNDDNIKVIDESIRDFWLEFYKILSSPEFLTPLLLKFEPWLISQCGEGVNISFGAQIDLTRDYRNWAIGPHTDHPNNIAVIILYLPSDDTKSYLGTSIYTPKESGFTCAGGPHHDRKKFDRANTVPYLPNSAISFFRNDVSFHGFEAVKNAGGVRNLIQISVIRTS